MAHYQDHFITVTRIGTDDPPLHSEMICGTRVEAERRCGDIWNDGYCMQPGRFRLTMKDADGKTISTID